mmetsp:Transcript_43486/g.120337  ORF Transcript_43486/g.120337 Transcript_43486/m.120337 type:complete len:227 (+) Transcript_43486:168-848(+)
MPSCQNSRCRSSPVSNGFWVPPSARSSKSWSCGSRRVAHRWARELPRRSRCCRCSRKLSARQLRQNEPRSPPRKRERRCWQLRRKRWVLKMRRVLRKMTSWQKRMIPSVRHCLVKMRRMQKRTHPLVAATPAARPGARQLEGPRSCWRASVCWSSSRRTSSAERPLVPWNIPRRPTRNMASSMGTVFSRAAGRLQKTWRKSWMLGGGGVRGNKVSNNPSRSWWTSR